MPALPFKLNQDRRHHIPRQTHKVTNWPAYDASLRRRGSLTVWFSAEAIEGWAAEPRTTPGGQPWYSALAILTALTLRAVFRLAYRQTEGLLGSVVGLLGLALRVPYHTTLCGRPRRAKPVLASPRRRAAQSKQTEGLRPAFEHARSVVRRPKKAGPVQAIPAATRDSLVSRRASPVGVAGRSGQVRPYVRPVARPTPLAIMGVRSRARHQSERRARGAAKSTVSPGLSRPQPFPSRRSALPAGPAGLASAASRAPERYAGAPAAAAARS